MQVNIHTDLVIAFFRLVNDLWTIVSFFAINLKSANKTNNLQEPIKQFLRAIQPIVGKIENDPTANTADTTSDQMATDTDLEGLRNMVDELKDGLAQSEDTITKIRREKNELMMKMSKAQAELKEREERITELQRHRASSNASSITTIVSVDEKQKDMDQNGYQTAVFVERICCTG